MHPGPPQLHLRRHGRVSFSTDQSPVRRQHVGPEEIGSTLDRYQLWSLHCAQAVALSMGRDRQAEASSQRSQQWRGMGILN